MKKSEWIESAVLRFRQCCEQMQDELGKAADGSLLDVADEQIFEKFHPLLREVQQEAIQKHVERKQRRADYRRCNNCKKNETQGHKIL
jgi:hypothetical protein